MSTIGKRLRSERERIGLTQTAFGAIGGVKKQAQLKYENDTSSPSANYLAEVAKVGVDVQFVLLGVNSNQPINQEEQELLSAFRSASQDIKDFLLNRAHTSFVATNVGQQIQTGSNASITYKSKK